MSVKVLENGVSTTSRHLKISRLQARMRTSWSAKLRTSVLLGVLAARAVPASAARATTKIWTALMVLGQLGSRLRLCDLAEGEL